jgi:hypothetical protein
MECGYSQVFLGIEDSINRNICKFPYPRKIECIFSLDDILESPAITAPIKIEGI